MAKKKNKQKKLPSLTTLKKRADRVMSNYVRTKANFTCEYCGKSSGITDCHHIISRTNLRLRHDPNNLICLCKSCHCFGSGSFHKNPLVTMEWFKENHPKRYEYLKKHYNEEFKLTRTYLNERIERYKSLQRP
jgi:5-methylcytosine-specific restriction endonuclease McrA